MGLFRALSAIVLADDVAPRVVFPGWRGVGNFVKRAPRACEHACGGGRAALAGLGQTRSGPESGSSPNSELEALILAGDRASSALCRPLFPTTPARDWAGGLAPDRADPPDTPNMQACARAMFADVLPGVCCALADLLPTRIPRRSSRWPGFTRPRPRRSKRSRRPWRSSVLHRRRALYLRA